MLSIPLLWNECVCVGVQLGPEFTRALDAINYEDMYGKHSMKYRKEAERLVSGEDCLHGRQNIRC